MAYKTTIDRRPMEALFDIRGDLSIVAEIAAAAGLTLPKQPNSMTSEGPVSILWIGPERWLLRAPLSREDELEATFSALIGDRYAICVLVSDLYAGINVCGPEARDVLAQGCPLDMRAEHFPVGAATSAEMFAITIILCHVNDEPSFSIYVERSYGDFILGRLNRGAFPVSHVLENT